MSCPQSLYPGGQHSWLMYDPKTKKRKANWRCLQCGKKRRGRS